MIRGAPDQCFEDDTIYKAQFSVRRIEPFESRINIGNRVNGTG